MNKIRRNSKNLSKIFSAAHSCKVFSLSNHFSGELLAADSVNDYLIKEFADTYTELVWNGKETYKLRVHSNLWYEFTAPAFA
jgi:hypothetical protein